MSIVCHATYGQAGSGLRIFHFNSANLARRQGTYPIDTISLTLKLPYDIKNRQSIDRMYASSILFHCCVVGSLSCGEAFTSAVSSTIPTIKVSSPLSTTTTKIYATTKPPSNKDEEMEVYGGPPDEYMPPKFNDGVTFNLFKSRLQHDEDTKYGAFTPPPNSLTDKVILITGASSGLGLESAKRLAWLVPLLYLLHVLLTRLYRLLML